MQIELAVFDLAGTTVKDYNDVPRVLMQALEKNEVIIPLEDACDVMGVPKPVAIRQLLLKHYTGEREITTEWIDEIHDDFIENMISFYETDPSVGEKDNASEIFAFLKKQNIRIVVDTGFDRSITNVLLERLGWVHRNLIDGSVTSDEVSFGRPYPDMIYRAMEITNIKMVQHVAKIGDTTSDLIEGANAGCEYVIGVTSGAQAKTKLQEHYHTHLIENLRELLPILTTSSMMIAS